MREPRRGSDQEGQALVEFAVLSTPLFLILLGAIQSGFIYATQITVVNMARDGARTAATRGPPSPHRTVMRSPPSRETPEFLAPLPRPRSPSP
jgi:Flp pilus assembly protein TadG